MRAGRAPRPHEWQNLVLRNQRLALELTKAQEINRNLRAQLAEAMIAKLQLCIQPPPLGVDKATQTNSETGEQVTPKLKKDSNLNRTISTGRTRTHRRVLANKEDEFREFLNIASPVHPEYDGIAREFADDKLEPCEAFSPRRSLWPPASRQSLPKESTANENTMPVLSPSQLRVTEALLENFHSPTRATDTLPGYLTPLKEVNRDERRDSLSGRTPRSTRKPLSYKEPSLSVKVRKGFQFFKFASTT